VPAPEPPKIILVHGHGPRPKGPRLGIPPFTMILQGKVEALHQMIRLWNKVIGTRGKLQVGTAN